MHMLGLEPGLTWSGMVLHLNVRSILCVWKDNPTTFRKTGTLIQVIEWGILSHFLHVFQTGDPINKVMLYESFTTLDYLFPLRIFLFFFFFKLIFLSCETAVTVPCCLDGLFLLCSFQKNKYLKIKSKIFCCFYLGWRAPVSSVLTESLPTGLREPDTHVQRCHCRTAVWSSVRVQESPVQVKTRSCLLYEPL